MSVEDPQDGRLPACPKTPNCVHSQSHGGGDQMSPIRFEGPLQAAFDRMLQVLRGFPRTRIVSAEPPYIHAEFTSALFRFTDDVQLLFDESQNCIHFRSASRVGRSDLGANRKRMLEIARAFETQP